MTNEEIAARIKQGETSLYNDLWCSNEKYFRKMSAKLYGCYRKLCDSSGVEFDDILQTCYFALRAAVEAYDSETGYKLLTFFKYPFMNFTTELVNGSRYKGHITTLNRCASLDKPLSEDDETTLGEVTADERAEQDYCNADEDETTRTIRAVIDSVLGRLPEEQAQVIRLMYGQNLTREKCAKVMGVASHTVRKNEGKALREFRKDKGIQVFSDEYTSAKAYRGTGFNAWKNEGSSVERLVERLEQMYAASC